MAMARSLAAGLLRYRIFASWCSSTVRYAHSPETLSQEEKNKEEASLPLPQRCKNHLASNWRGQLSSINGDDKTIHGSLAHCALVAGQTLVWIPKNDDHGMNLLIDNRGSLVVGHTDPPPLFHAFNALGHVPPRTLLLGEFGPLASHEVEYVRKRVLKLMSSTKQAVETAGPGTQSLLQESGNPLIARVRALEMMAHCQEDQFNVYRLSPRTCHYVDLLGGTHHVDVTELMGAATDHLCPLLPALIEGVNQSDTRRMALIMFCAVYMQERVQDAYLFGADRWGINILAKVAEGSNLVDSSESQPSEVQRHTWREFRFAFSQEVKSTEHFCIVLAEMEKECLDTLNKARELNLLDEK